MNIIREPETERVLIRQFNHTDEEGYVNFITESLITDHLAFTDSYKSKEGSLTILNQTIQSYSSDHPLLAFNVV
jgi:hypothetical protein